MPSDTVVYIVLEHDWTSSNILGVFATRKLAETFVNSRSKYDADWLSIAEFSVQNAE